MSENNWQRMFDLLDQALERPPDERTGFLERACGDDAELRREIDALLEASAQSDGVLEQNVVDVEAGLRTGDGSTRADTLALQSEPARRSEPRIGDVLGPYRLVDRIGEGGMGIVFAAEQHEPIRRRVALKVIKPGMDSREVIARFESERQALALMDHPHIARVFDAGSSAAGLPFFAMELASGTILTSYCDEHRLSVEERLELFLPLCDALQHAHQKGIIHRDIKPSNILVTERDGRPTPKIIDFGIAKAIDHRLTEHTLYTRLGHVIGTPSYMSPEQARGRAVDTRTDIYSLGMVLYEILTGRRPFAELLDGASYPEMQKIVAESELPRPSATTVSFSEEDGAEVARLRCTDSRSLMQQLRGDLDWIVLRATDKDPSRRYATVSELAQDVRRHLADEPVLAGPPTLRYRAGKFVRRHRLAVSVATGVAALVVASALALGVQSTRLTRSLAEAQTLRARAELQREEAQEITDFLVESFESADPLSGEGSDPTLSARQILDRGARRIGTELGRQPELQASLMATMGQAYMGLGLYDSAEPLLTDSLELRRRVLPATDPDVISGLLLLAQLERTRSSHQRAVELAREALSLTRSLHPPHPSLIAALSTLAMIELDRAEYDAARRHLEEAMAVERQLAAQEPGRESASLRRLLGELERGEGDYSAAEQAFRELLELQRTTSPRNPGMLSTLTGLGTVLNEMGKESEARSIQAEALALGEELLGKTHPSLVGPRNNLALAAHNLGDHAVAEELYRRNLELVRATHGDVHFSVAIGLNNLGLVLHDQGRLIEAEERFRQALDVQRQLVGSEHPNIAYHLNNLARVLQDQGRFGEAEPLYREALRLRVTLLADGHPTQADSMTWLGALLVERSRAGEAEPLLRRAVEIRTAAHGLEDWRTAEARSLLGGCLTALGRLGEAEPLLVETYDQIRQQRGDAFRRTPWALQRIVDYYEAAGREDEAARWRAKAGAGAEGS